MTTSSNLLIVVPVSLWLPSIGAAFFVGRRQFSLTNMFVLVTIEAILLGLYPVAAPTFAIRRWSEIGEMFIATIVFTQPIGIPLLWAAYAIGRRQTSTSFWISFLVIEILSITFAFGLSTT